MTEFRAMKDGEEGAVIALWKSCSLTRPWNDPTRDIDFARGKTNSEVLVAEEDGRLIATVMVGHDGHRGAIYYLAVEPAMQRRGLGRAAVAAAEAWLKARGVWKVNLLVRTENSAVLGFYQKLGYEDGGVMSLGRRIDHD